MLYSRSMDVRGEKDIEQLRRIALAQQVQIEQLVKVLAAQSRRIDELVGKDGELQQALSLLEELGARAPQTSSPAASPDDELKEEKEKKPRTKSGPTAQPLLSVVEQVFELDEPDRICPSCGGELQPMKDQYETSKLIDVVEVTYRIVKAKQQKYVCHCGGCVETAPGPERAVRGGRYSLDFAIKVAIDKYLDHAPLARQVRILLRHGVETTTQTLWDQVHAVGSELRPIYDALFARLLRCGVIGLDQTSWKRLEQKGAKPWQMWCITSPDTVYHRICDDKGKDTFTSLLGGYRGVIVCDALSTHGAGARDAPGIALAGCSAHVFRKFREAEPDHPEAVLAMKWIDALYEIDRRAGDDETARAALRRAESATVLGELKAWLFIQAPLKTLSIGAAARYTLGNSGRLTRFVDDPLIPLDNNQTERGIRGPVVGRKNHYGSKSRRGTEIAAILYTLIETAKLNGLDPARYLRDAVLAVRRGEILLPQPASAEA